MCLWVSVCACLHVHVCVWGPVNERGPTNGIGAPDSPSVTATLGRLSVFVVSFKLLISTTGPESLSRSPFVLFPMKNRQCWPSGRLSGGSCASKTHTGAAKRSGVLCFAAFLFIWIDDFHMRML